MAIINFKGYSVENLSYEKNPNFHKDVDPKELKSDIRYSIDRLTDSEANLYLNVSIGDFSDQKSPFVIHINVRGRFVYTPDESETDFDFNDLLSTNGVAILYPYVRSLVSLVSGQSGEFPMLLLPTINVPQMLKKVQ
jgi:preprotein translocase subunit SecB